MGVGRTILAKEPFHLDWEVKSATDLEDYGLDNFVRDPYAAILLGAFARGDRPPKLWQPHLKSIPAELEDALLDPNDVVFSWNSQFERIVAKFLLGIDKPIRSWRDPMVCARYLSLPGGLEDAGNILGLKDSAKMAEDGKRLVRLFCTPETVGGSDGLFGVKAPTFRDWTTDPADWDLFGKYCCQDTVAERAALKKMSRFLPSEAEWENWFLDQKMNDAGWPTDQTLGDGAKYIVQRALEPMIEEIKNLSGILNVNSTPQMLAWLQTQGYIFSSLEKAFVARALKGECNLSPEARRVLELRGQTAKSSVSKYTAISDLAGPDGRLRYQYTHYGARTGRVTSQGVNVANLPRPTKAVEKNLNQAVELVRLMDYDGIVREFGKPLEVASSVLRSAFRAPKGKKFVVVDLNAIENRMLGWLARCDPILKVFRDGLDPYLSFATKLYGDSYDYLWYEWKILEDSTKRNNAKAPVLGSGYGLGPGEETVDEDGNVIWTGLRGYAIGLGVQMTQEEAVLATKIFRESYPEVVRLWKDLERAATFAIRHPGQLVGVGVPHSDRDKEYFERLGRPVLEPLLHFKATGERVLEMILPSGRPLFYIDPEVQQIEKEWNGRKYTQDVISHMGRDQKTKQWVRMDTYGSRLLENGDQGASRDVLFEGLQAAEAMGFEIIGETYDEAVTLVDANGSLGVEDLRACLTGSRPWREDLPLSAEGYEDDVYHK